MLTNECWLGYHDFCEAQEFCGCMCHDTWSATDYEQLAHWSEGGAR